MNKEELKPCPFCGRSGPDEGPKCSLSGEWGCDFCCEYEYEGMNISFDKAQNAYCWKEIDRLNQHIADSMISRTEQIAKLEAELETEKTQHRIAGEEFTKHNRELMEELSYKTAEVEELIKLQQHFRLFRKEARQFGDICNCKDSDKCLGTVGMLWNQREKSEQALSDAREALENIKKHQEMNIKGDDIHFSTTWQIATKALAAVEKISGSKQ